MNTKRAAHLAAETEDSMGRMKDLHAARETVDIVDVFADAVLVPVTEVRAGDYVFDTYGGRHRVERAEWSHGGDMVTIKRADWRAEHFWPDSTITIIRGER